MRTAKWSFCNTSKSPGHTCPSILKFSFRPAQTRCRTTSRLHAKARVSTQSQSRRDRDWFKEIRLAGGVHGCGRLAAVRRHALVRLGVAGRVRDRRVADAEVVGVRLRGHLASDQAAPGLVALGDDLSRVLLVLSLAREGKLVLRLSIGDLVDAIEMRFRR